ncbi:MAG TPA: hypothetical protein VKG85_09160 [Actinomycetes bacterium]|nr:hypothetical protein [Actinomycetes bacterium]
MRNPPALAVFRPRVLAGLLLAAAVALTAGCGAEGFALDSPAGANGRRGNADDGDGSVRSREQVLKQYRKFWRVTSHLTDVPSHERPALIGEVATSPILPIIMTNLARMDTAGEVLYGEPRARSPRVEFDGRTAIVRDCQDTSNSGRKKASTDQILSKGVDRAAVTVMLKRGKDGVWRASEVSYPAGKRC